MSFCLDQIVEEGDAVKFINWARTFYVRSIWRSEEGEIFCNLGNDFQDAEYQYLVVSEKGYIQKYLRRRHRKLLRRNKKLRDKY
jgi:hypothetical protein